jgi:hypothetical protein
MVPMVVSYLQFSFYGDDTIKVMTSARSPDVPQKVHIDDVTASSVKQIANKVMIATLNRNVSETMR